MSIFIRIPPALAGRTGRGSAWVLVGLLFVFWREGAIADSTNEAPASPTIDLASPAVMTGTLYEIGSNRKTVLFKYRREATRTGQLIRVEISYTLPDGSVACREHIQYQEDRLLDYQMEDLRARALGTIKIEPDPGKPKKERVFLEYHQGDPNEAKSQKKSEVLQPNMVISDTVYPFILTHWDELQQGTAVKFHFICLDPATTFNFRLTREPDGSAPDQTVVKIKMEPTNLIIAHWVRPIIFTVEKAAPHRVFSYIGRTTPRTKVGGAWKGVEAEAVFDWP